MPQGLLLQHHLQQGYREKLVQCTAQRLEIDQRRLAEHQHEFQAGAGELRLATADQARHPSIEFFEIHRVAFALGQVVDRTNAWQDAVTARLGEK